jgi:Secretion system C-terminal sorting domain
MKQLFSLLLLCLIAQLAQSQSVIGSVGGGGTVGTMTISYTVGEAVISTVENANTRLNQGFHQARYVVTALKETFPAGTVTVSPNPTSSILQVQLMGIAFDNIIISLTDVVGRSIITAKVTHTTWQTDLSDLANGYYLLIVEDTKTHTSNSFKIFKSN